MGMIMKQLFYGIAALLAFLMTASCTKQDDIYQEWVKEGGYTYPAKSAKISTVVGYCQMTLSWNKPKDPAVKTAKVFWDNYSDSLLLDYSSFPEGIVTVTVPDLDERSYTFEVVNYDANGNRSLPAEVVATPYGKTWFSTKKERFVVDPRMNGKDAVIVMNDPKSANADQHNDPELVATKFRYRNGAGEWTELEGTMDPASKSITFPDALEGKYFEFRSAYKKTGAVDTVWRENWVKSGIPILYRLHTEGWTVACTTGQTLNAASGPENIFDGIIDANHRYHSSNASNRTAFPKILAIDTHSEAGKEPTFTGFRFHRNPVMNRRYINHLYLYIGNAPYDPDEPKPLDAFGTPSINNTQLYWSEQAAWRGIARKTGSCIGIVFTDSRNTRYGYIDLWELEVWGFIAAEAD